MPGSVVSAVAGVLWCCCHLGDRPLASQTLLAVALWIPGTSRIRGPAESGDQQNAGTSTLFCCWWGGCRVVSLPRCAMPVAEPGRKAGSGCGSPGFPGSPGSPAPGSPWGQGAAAPPGCRLHLAALGDELPAGEGTACPPCPPPSSSGELRFNPFSPSALPRASSGSPWDLSRVFHRGGGMLGELRAGKPKGKPVFSRRRVSVEPEGG